MSLPSAWISYPTPHSRADWKYIVRTTHSKNQSRKGSTANDGAVRSSFEQDVKVMLGTAKAILEVIEAFSLTCRCLCPGLSSAV